MLKISYTQLHPAQNVKCVYHANAGFEQNIDIQVYKEERWYPSQFKYLQWSQLSLYEDLKEHFKIRKGLFDKMGELLYILYRTSNQLKIDFSDGGSFSKFKRDFFNLFGLSDKDYDKKVKLVLKRKRSGYLITKLEKKNTEEHAKRFTVKK